MKQTLPVPAAAAVPAGDRADEADVAGQPHTVLRPRQTSFKYDLNDELAKFGKKFRATAKSTEYLRDDPELKGLLKRLPDEGEIKEFTECPFCQKGAVDFSKKFAFYRHIRGGSCSYDDFVKYAGIDLRARARELVISVKPARPIDDAAKADGHGLRRVS